MKKSHPTNLSANKNMKTENPDKLKLSHKIILIVGMMIMLWGVLDFWNFSTIFQEAAQHYGTDMIGDLGRAQMVGGIVKTTIGLVMTGFVVWKKKKR